MTRWTSAWIAPLPRSKPRTMMYSGMELMHLICRKNSGTSKIRGQDVSYRWSVTADDSPVEHPGPVGRGAAGDIRMHRHSSGIQVWILEPSALSSNLQWTIASHGHRHPDLDTHVLCCDGASLPTWVTKPTLVTYRSKKRGRSMEAEGKTEPKKVSFGRRRAGTPARRAP